jgi:hypothetical protein
MTDENAVVMIDDSDESLLGGFNEEAGWDEPAEDDASAHATGDNVELEGGDSQDATAQTDTGTDDGASADDNADTGAVSETGEDGAKADTGKDTDTAAAKEPSEIVNLKKQIEAQNEQILNMAAAMQNLRQSLTAKQGTPAGAKPRELPPEPSPEDWETDPAKAARQMMDRERAIMQAERERSEQHAQRQNVQRQSWAAATQIAPELITNSPVRKITEQIYANEALGLKDNPLGPFLAACAALVVGGKHAPQGNKPGDDVDSKLAKEVGAAEERARQARVKAGVMHGGGKGGKSAKVSTPKLSAEEVAWARKLGITEEQYASGKAAAGLEG